MTVPSPSGSPPAGPPSWDHHGRGRWLSAFLVTLNIAVILLIYFLFWRFFWNKKSTPGDENNSNASSTTTSPSNSPRARRVDSHVVASLPVSVHEGTTDADKLECAVCLSEVKNGDRCRVLPRCSHKFHVECVDMWFQFHSTCPLCRAAVESKAPAPPGSDGDQVGIATTGDALV
ncbi:RING-H2 finger protein ATL39-like [Typha angustifolia]|uniref:RING-H2 finger protein ATL39-like n=1 Tax=Typha angustifolia TaxID=59011 RepID=UPI003C2EE8A1